MKRLTLEETKEFCKHWQLYPRVPNASEMEVEVEQVEIMLEGMGRKATKKDIRIALNKRKDKNIETNKMIREESEKVRKELGLPIEEKD